MGQKCLLWGILGHGWDTLLHMNFADFHMTWKFKSLILLKKTHALGRSLVIFKNPVSRRLCGTYCRSIYFRQNGRQNRA
ncbi:hypothetical protein DTY81_25035 [Escherichia coli]|nr:hypothetical protein [Escherichia coli]